MARVLIVWDTTVTHAAEIDLADYNGDPSSIDTNLLAQHETDDGRNPDREVAEVVVLDNEEPVSEPSDTADLTTAEKIRAIETSGLKIAFDGCHKIYFLTDEERTREAADCGYEPFFPASEVRELISSSCGLVFVTQWPLTNSDDHPWDIEQFTDDIRTAAEGA